MEYKGYKGSVEYSKEDDCLCGKVQGLNKVLILYEGQTLAELRKDFEDGHSRVAAAASSSDTTINDFINKAIKNALKHASVL